MKTLTLEQAVSEAIQEFLAANKSFSAHEVTTAVRKKANSGEISISGVPYGYVNQIITNGQQIEHADVRDIVGQLSISLDLDVSHSNGAYKVYSGKPVSVTNTPVTNIPSKVTLDITKRLSDIIVNQLNVNAVQVTPSANLIDDLGADSLDAVELMMAVEEEFKDILGGEITESEAEKMKTIGDIITFLEQRAGIKTTTPATAPASPALAVPQRFTVAAPVDVKDHVTSYVREKLQAGINPNLHQIAKTVRITVEEVRQIVIAAGWSVYTPTGQNPNSISAMEVR
jgi:acyl carrier protein